MANCLMQINQCGFPNCGQHFANQYDLTAHIEYTHIPMIEEETKRKAQLAAAAAASGTDGETPAVPVTNNLPLSYYSRVFRTAYRPNPIKPEPLKVSFNHYKKRALREKTQHPNLHIYKVYREMLISRGRNTDLLVSLEDIEKRLGDVDFEECGPDNNEVRFRCHIVDCMKRYKNMFALRMHMKMLHSVVISEDAKSLTNFPLTDNVRQVLDTLKAQQPGEQQGSATPESSSGSQSAGAPTNPASTPQQQAPPAMPQFGNPATTPTSYKCTYCTKRYKTSSGLSNHMMASHQKISDAQDAPSPQVVEQLISQVRMQRQQQEANSLEQKSGQLAGQQQLGNIFEGSSVRSYTVTTTPQPLRFNQQHYPVNLDNQPSTGQVLQMHMQQQRRMKQLQEQQAAAAAAAAAQQQQQQQAQQMQPQGMPSQQGYAPPPQSVGSPMGPPMQQQPIQQLPGPSQQQALPSLQPPSQQQYHQMPPPQQHQQSSSYPQMHQMQSQHHYQQNAPYPQQSPQFPPYQQQSPQGPPPQGPPQRSPIPLSQALPPLNSMTQRQQMPPMQPPNAVPMHLSPPNQQGYDMMTSPPSGQQMGPPPPPYNL